MQHFRTLDALRAYMAWWVVLQHIVHLGGGAKYLNRYVYIAATSGGVAVSVFIIISGYVIAHLMAGKRETYGPYLIRRFFRIYPVYAIAVMAAIGLTPLYASLFGHEDWIVGAAARLERLGSEARNFAWHAWGHITLMHGAIPDSILPWSSEAFLAPGWSLSLEWQFYLLAPAVGLLGMGKGWQRFGVLALTVAGVVAAWSGILGSWHLPSNILLSVQYFLIGMVTRWLLGGRHVREVVPALVSIGICFILSGTRFSAFDALATAAALAIWGVAVVCMLHESGGRFVAPALVARVFRLVFLNGVIQKIGIVSYSTYLMHLPVLTIGLAVPFILLRMPPSPAAYLTAMVAMCPIILWVSFLSYRFIERPGIDIGRRFSGAARAKVALAGGSS